MRIPFNRGLREPAQAPASADNHKPWWSANLGRQKVSRGGVGPLNTWHKIRIFVMFTAVNDLFLLYRCLTAKSGNYHHLDIQVLLDLYISPAIGVIGMLLTLAMVRSAYQLEKVKMELRQSMRHSGVEESVIESVAPLMPKK